MKKFIISLIVLLPLIILGCKTTKVENEIELPPKPQRQELKSPESLSDLADLLNYYEHLVEQWENWADRAEKLIKQKK
jgi:hypothetical protein